MQRFWDKVKKSTSSDCWEWTAARTQSGYGQIGIDGVVKYAHRFSWELHFDEIPDGLCVCHHCDNPGCVNPNHLFVGTIADNNRDMSVKGRQRGPSGEKSANSKLTKEDVLEIRRLYAIGDYLQREIADQFNIDRSQISRVVCQKTWKHPAVQAAKSANEGKEVK